jgi:hypothetical protein
MIAWKELLASATLAGLVMSLKNLPEICDGERRLCRLVIGPLRDMDHIRRKELLQVDSGLNLVFRFRREHS